MGFPAALFLRRRRRGGSGAVPANAIRQRDGAYILDRAGNYIEVRA
jgi:hypothetical protein